MILLLYQINFAVNFSTIINQTNMKKYFLIICLMLSLASFTFRSPEKISLNNPNNQHDHFNHPVPADMPDVYYNNSTQTLIIDGTGEVNYYDVEVISLTTLDTEISTQVNGYYDTIDVSSLPEGEYAITIDAPTGNSFEGFFSTY